MSIKVMTEVWGSSQATGTKRLMMLALADHANDEGCCFPGISSLALKCKISERNAQLVLRDLEESGELITERGTGRRNTNMYWVFPPGTVARLLLELPVQLERVKSSDERVKISAQLERVKFSAERVKFSAQRVKPSAERVQQASPEPSVTVIEPSEEPSEGESVPATPAVSAEGQDQDTSTGAADAAGANTPTSPPVQEPVQPTANGGAPNATSSNDVPPAAVPVENPVDNFPDTPIRAFLVGCFGAKWLGDLMGEDRSRSDWFSLPAETFQIQKDDAVTTSPKGKWKSSLINLLDAQAAMARRARRAPISGPSSIARSRSEELKAQLATQRPE
ncbi:helix-turn-helix domain-containing protein [Deinococcus sp. UYEF24]